MYKYTYSCTYVVVIARCRVIFFKFLIFCNLFHEPLGEESICQYCTRQRGITTLSLNACLSKMYQELSYLLIVSGLFNIIKCYIGTNKQKEKLKVLTLPGYVLYFLTALYFHISIQIFFNLFIYLVFDGLLQSIYF